MQQLHAGNMPVTYSDYSIFNYYHSAIILLLNDQSTTVWRKILTVENFDKSGLRKF